MTIKPKKVYKDIDLTLTKTFRNDIRKKEDVDAINQHLRLLFLTEQNEIPFLNNISSDIRSILFENYDLHSANTLNALIRNIIIQLEPRINLLHVQNDLNKNDLEVTISYIIKQSNTSGTFKTILKKTR